MGDKCNQLCRHNQGNGTCQYEKHETWLNFGTKECADEIDREVEKTRLFEREPEIIMIGDQRREVYRR